LCFEENWVPYSHFADMGIKKPSSCLEVKNHPDGGKPQHLSYPKLVSGLRSRIP